MHPFNLPQHRLLQHNVLECRKHDIEFAGLDLLSDGFAFPFRALHCDDAEDGGPFFEFEGPVGHCRKRDDDEERAALFLDFVEVGEERDGLLDEETKV